MISKNPKVTVLMPVYNGEKYLGQAIESILAQTFTDLELLIINDGSTDGSKEIIESYEDSRIRLVNNEGNLKLIATLNKGFELAQGEYIARMDCDDISLPDRLAKQVAFMEAHPQVGVCGTWAHKIDSSGKIVGKLKRPAGNKLEKFLWCPSPIIHPTAIIRNTVFKTLRYDQAYRDAEDYELWLRVSKVTKLYNLKEYLLLYRVHPASVTSVHRDVQLQSSYKAFSKFHGSRDISYDEFLSFMFAAGKVNPWLRALKIRKLAVKYKISPLELWQDNLKYLIYWVLSIITGKR
ncbi:MAG: glycosyltransferase family 2 protein [Thermincolia bacterium]